MLLMLVSLVRAQDVKVVKEIVVNGNVRVSKEAILSSMSTKVGSTYNEAALDTDRQTLFDRSKTEIAGRLSYRSPSIR
jgi:outer membrane protein assembly factor BamA